MIRSIYLRGGGLLLHHAIYSCRTYRHPCARCACALYACMRVATNIYARILIYMPRILTYMCLVGGLQQMLANIFPRWAARPTPVAVEIAEDIQGHFCIALMGIRLQNGFQGTGAHTSSRCEEILQEPLQISGIPMCTCQHLHELNAKSHLHREPSLHSSQTVVDSEPSATKTCQKEKHIVSHISGLFSILLIPKIRRIIMSLPAWACLAWKREQ